MHIRTCTKCKLEKPTSDFYKDSRQSTGIRPNCKECSKRASKEKYNNDPEFKQRKLDTAAAYQKGARRDMQIKVLTILKSTGCKDCGETDPIVLDFDHIHDKFDGISRMIRNHRSWALVELEIAKCEVRCSNCHRRKTARERGYYLDIDLDAL